MKVSIVTQVINEFGIKNYTYYVELSNSPIFHGLLILPIVIPKNNLEEYYA